MLLIVMTMIVEDMSYHFLCPGSGDALLCFQRKAEIRNERFLNSMAGYGQEQSVLQLSGH